MEAYYLNAIVQNVMGGDGVIPNLAYSGSEIFATFDRIVGNGVFLEKGMPDIGDRLSDQDILNIKNYILSDAKSRRAAQTNGDTQ